MQRVCIGLYSGGAFYGIMPIKFQAGVGSPLSVTLTALKDDVIFFNDMVSYN